MKYIEIEEAFNNDKELLLLYNNLNNMHKKCRSYVKNKYNRVNPFIENFFDWKEKGAFFGGKNITIYDSSSISGNLKVGNNTWIGPYTSIDASGGLRIGEYCSISAGVRIVSHDSIKWALSGGEEDYEYSSIKIGNYCFIGANSVITKGVSIGNRCLVAAGSVVSKDFNDNSIIAGVPAKEIGKVHVVNGRIEYEYYSKKRKTNSQ